MKVRPVIRSAVTADIPLLAALVRQYWEFESIDGFATEAVASLLARLIAEPGLGSIWVAADGGGQLLGYLVAVHVFSLEQQGLMAEIDELFVAPAARAGGVGAALLSVAQSDLAARGCVCLQLQLATDNSAARGFYRRHGYRERTGYELLDKRLV